jgi:hypothetical protein
MTATALRVVPARRRKVNIVTRQLEILALRSIELADRVAAGRLGFLAIDASGLIDSNITTGDDVVQATIAAAFANARGPA